MTAPSSISSGIAPGTSPGVGPGSARAWLLAARPATLSAAVVPVAVGTACAAAAAGFRPGPALAALLGAIFIQIGTNFANDVFDYEQGADTAERLGPTRATQAGLLTPRAMRVGMIAAFGLAALAGVYLIWVAGWPVLAIGVASVLSGIAYTGGPYPLGYHGLGDVFVMIFFGFVAVCGTAFVQLGQVPALAWWAAVPVGSLATAILVVNNVRDRVTDAKAGKRTLAVRLGRGGGIAEYVLLIAAAYATPVVLFALGLAGWSVLLPVLTLPLALAQIRVLVAGTEGPRLNLCLKRTAQILLGFGLLFAIGLTL
jgi:1,4-dihydroxy-2-naphthoate polyprenyltransferase